MNCNIEKEYKILVTKEQFIRILQDYPQAEFKKQVNTYYDTDDLAIRHAHGAMRIRTIDHHFLFTLKLHTKAGVEEYEKYVETNDPIVFKDQEIAALLKAIPVLSELKRITELTTYRAMIFTGDAELCFDVNRYGSCEDYEIEYEYKRPHDGPNVFNKILAKVNLTYTKNCHSKIRRAFDAHFTLCSDKDDIQ